MRGKNCDPFCELFIFASFCHGVDHHNNTLAKTRLGAEEQFGHASLSLHNYKVMEFYMLVNVWGARCLIAEVQVQWVKILWRARLFVANQSLNVL
jgi:hypothetical protein